jgi:hypothetical protein
MPDCFPAICLVFGLLCAVVAMRAYFVEMRDINHAAAVRRVEFPDDRPLAYMPNSYPWKHEDWRKL